MKLSERLEVAAKIHVEIGGQSALAKTIREAAELARSVEDAPCAVAGQSPGRFYYVGGSAPVEHGQRVRIVPEAGQGEG